MFAGGGPPPPASEGGGMGGLGVALKRDLPPYTGPRLYRTLMVHRAPGSTFQKVLPGLRCDNVAHLGPGSTFL